MALPCPARPPLLIAFYPMLMKKKLLLALLLLGHTTTWAQSVGESLMQFSCPQPAKASRASSKAIAVEAPPAVANRPPVGPGPTQPSCSGIINVNIHFMLRLSGIGNFNETDNGFAYKPWNANTQQDPTIPADTANNGYARALAVVADMNSQAASNPLNSNPAGTANPAKGFSYVLSGVYFHRVKRADYQIIKDDYTGYATTAPFDTYGVNKATEINMFMTGNYTNGACCDIGGIACGLGYDPATPGSYWVKVFNSYEFYCWRQQNNGNTIILPSGVPYTVPQDSQSKTANTLGHEIGHLLGLQHAFAGANSCVDAAIANQGSSNNQMDYTNASGTALTPCQLDVVNTNLYNPANPANSYHNYLSTANCGELPPRAFFMPYQC